MPGRGGARYYDAMSDPDFPTAGSSTLMLAGPAGPLEVAVDLPDDDVTALPVVAIVCHPLSTEGGTLHNKVVTMTATTLRELGIDPATAREYREDTVKRWRQAASKRAGGAASAGGTGGSAAGDAGASGGAA